MQKEARKGLSQIITVIILILIAIVAVLIVWAVVSSIMKQESEEADLKLRCSEINLEIEKSSASCFLSQPNILTARVKRGNDNEGNIQLKLVAGEYVVTQDAPTLLSSKAYQWNPGNGASLTAGAKIELRVAAVILKSSGKAYTCSTSQKVVVTCTSGSAVCIPQCAGKQCGGDSCGGNCGLCSSGTCNSSGQCVTTQQTTTSITQYGITWYFDKEYQYGTFANGDYWVLGPVKIINIDPPSLNVSGRIKNGAMINPVAGSNQGYDNSITAYGSPLYVSSLNAARPNGNDLSASNSLILQPGSSLVSVISYDVPQGIVYLRTAAILTILQSPAVEGSFRPPYSGNDKNVK